MLDGGVHLSSTSTGAVVTPATCAVAGFLVIRIIESGELSYTSEDLVKKHTPDYVHLWFSGVQRPPSPAASLRQRTEKVSMQAALERRALVFTTRIGTTAEALALCNEFRRHCFVLMRRRGESRNKRRTT